MLLGAREVFMWTAWSRAQWLKWLKELVPLAALKPRTQGTCQSFGFSRVCPGQISKRVKGDYVLSGTQKPATFCFWYIAWEKHQLVFYSLCSLDCLLLSRLMHRSSFLLMVNTISISAWESHWPGDLDDGDFQAQRPPLWNSDSASTYQPVAGHTGFSDAILLRHKRK